MCFDFFNDLFHVENSRKTTLLWPFEDSDATLKRHTQDSISLHIAAIEHIKRKHSDPLYEYRAINCRKRTKNIRESLITKKR